VIRACLRANGVEEVFAFVIGYPKLFGKAKVLRRILRVEKAGRDGLLFVGDELRDLEAGRKAKVATVAVTWGFQDERLLRTGGATYLAHRPDEVLALTDLS
jgi:phosphoglycolate phosphatase